MPKKAKKRSVLTLVRRTSDAVDKSRKACCKSFASLLQDEKLAQEMEQALYMLHGDVNQDYRAAYRRLLIALKDPNNTLKTRLISGDLSPSSAVELRADQLLSSKRKIEDDKLLQENLRQTVSEVLPDNISAFKDGREGEKWFGGKSAAAIDD